MRIASVSLILATSLLTLACGDNGSGTESQTTTQTATSLTTVPLTTGDTTEAAPTGSATDATGGSGGATDTATTDTPTTDASTTSPVGSTTELTATTDPSGSSTGGPPCEEIKATLMPIPPNIMLVLDKSGSMVANPSGLWDHDADPNTPKITRWNSLYQVVQLVVTDYNDSINFGANLFPSTAAQQKYDASACVVNANVEIPVAAKNKDAILNGIPQAGDTLLKGGTPTASGITAALNHLKTLDPQVPAAILLVTDGAANCAMGAQPPPLFESYDQNLHTIVQNALANDNIATYVVGIDTKDVVSDNAQDGNPNATNTYQKLNELAVDGGKPKDDPNEKFYNAVNQIQLKAALDAIAADALSCFIPLESQPGFPDETKVKIAMMEIPHVMDCNTENGWVYEDDGMGLYTGIRLCGTACDKLKMEKAADVEFYCSAG
ncbi:vWA domain-containing protein [Nannocystis sp.]|uniref:vWA domain-containing protein n=1 Tax=Nannocystis sp. TaxID=1962667 RepID=UPI0025F8EA8A|nr:vWA domain-containing protein [Nannocystis sp.]MBK7826643.1 VWA domain-containing protein [Nannocystis sp.]